MSTSNPSSTVSKFPHGFNDGVAIRGVPVLNSYPAAVFWVDSVHGSDGNRGTFDRPFATIAKALTLCTTANGDLILAKAGHVETVVAAGTVTISITGVNIIGLGSGSQRPKFDFTTATTASVLITGASTTIQNFVCLADVDQLTNPFNIQAADCYLDIEWRDTATNVEAVRAVLGNASADRLYVSLKYNGQTGGSHCVNAIRLVGSDNAKINIDFYGKASTSIVEFVTTACTNVTVSGYFYNSGTTDLSKNIVDTVTGSTWAAKESFDGAAGKSFSGGSGSAIGSSDATTVVADLAVPTADVTTNALERDVVGNKTDAAVTANGTTKSLMAYQKGLITMSTVQSADSTNNAFAGDVVGNKTDAAVYAPAATKSVLAYSKGAADLQDNIAVSATATMVNGNTIFTVAGGPIQILSLISECITSNDATASTVQYSATATGLSAQTISAASGSVASATLHATVSLIGTALSTAAVYNANGVNLGMTNSGGVVVPVGTIKLVIGVGSTTGTWRHLIRYRPLTTGVTVS